MSKSSRSNKHDQWSELKRLLMEEEVARLQRIEDKVIPPDKFAKAIGEVLPDAVQNTEDKQRLSQKLYPVVEESLYKSVQKNPDSLADAIYPIMAPAIRKAINEAMKKVTESVNSSVNSGLSAKTIKWRLQALFSGQSYGELVLKYSLLYQVQELYLIHNETGLLISHLSQKTGDNPDGDMISGMLTAIRNFVSDSFNVGENESLEAIQVGELVVIIEQGPHASLACVVKGDSSTDFRDTLKLAIENIHQEFGSDLSKFYGDPAPLEDAKLMMEPCLVTQLDQGEIDESGKLGKILLFFGIILLILIGYSSYWGAYWNGLKKDLNENTRFEVVLSSKSWHNYTLIATNANKQFIDHRLEADTLPSDSLKHQLRLNKYNLGFESFVDFHLRKGKNIYAFKEKNITQNKDTELEIDSTEISEPIKINRFYRFKKKRLQSLLLTSTSLTSVKNLVKSSIPSDEDGVFVNIKGIKTDTINTRGDSLFYIDTIVKVTGVVSSERYDSLRSVLPVISEDYIIDVKDLTIKIPYTPEDTLKFIQGQIDSLLLFFKVGSDELLPNQDEKIKLLQDHLIRANSLCQELDQIWVLSISGSSDESGTRELNEDLEQQRSFFAVDEIIPYGLKSLFVIWKRATLAKRKRIEGMLDNEMQKRHVSFELKNPNEP